MNNNNNNNNKSSFCKVCFDSGKPNTNHWVKDRNGKVCCPTLIGLKCRLCGECGHTVKYCNKPATAKPLLATAKPLLATAAAKPLVNVPMQKVTTANKFELLFNYDDDDDDDDTAVKPSQEKKKPPQQKPKRWIDYDSDFDDDDDDESPPPQKVLVPPTLKRYGHSDNSDDSNSFIETSI